MPNRNQTFDSNGPDLRIRGTAHQVHEKYQSLARDAASAGDRVMAENYQQHAEHYYRIILAMNEAHDGGQLSGGQPGQGAHRRDQGDMRHGYDSRQDDGRQDEYRAEDQRQEEPRYGQQGQGHAHQQSGGSLNGSRTNGAAHVRAEMGGESGAGSGRLSFEDERVDDSRDQDTGGFGADPRQTDEPAPRAPRRGRRPRAEAAAVPAEAAAAAAPPPAAEPVPVVADGSAEDPKPRTRRPRARRTKVEASADLGDA